MKKTIAALILFAGAALAQNLPFDSMRGTYRVVTNEQDTAAIELLNASNAVAVSVSAGLTESNALRVAEIAGLVPQITGLYASNATVFASVGALELGTNGWNAAAAHAATAHSVTADGGFAGGTGATATTGGAIGLGAVATSGGAVGKAAGAASGGAVGGFAVAGAGFAGGSGARAASGGAVGWFAVAGAGFAGGYGAQVADGDTLIDAIQLGTGVNPDAGTLQVYTHKLLDADGKIPVERIPVAITNPLLPKAEAAATYLPLANIPGPGCTDLGSTNFFDVSGATIYYRGVMSGAATATVTKAVSEGWTYALTVVGTNTLIISNATLLNTWTPGGTNTYVFTPSTTNAWEVRGMTP